MIVREGLDKAVLESVLNPKYSITGIQFPGEDGITADGIDYILSLNSGYYFDFRRIDGQNSSAIFAFDSDIYAEMEANGEFEDFDRLVTEVLNDTDKKSQMEFMTVTAWNFILDMPRLLQGTATR